MSKAITKHLAEMLKTKEGLFLETSALDYLKELRNIADKMRSSITLEKQDKLMREISKFEKESSKISS